MRGETYIEFEEKFKPKKTTDDCYTPPTIYSAIRDWACKEYGIDPEKIVRPFYPGGDYENYDYKEGAVVVDNPPFSIITKICAFYLDAKIPFFLFAPSLTNFSGREIFEKINHVICDANITYENGAVVKTSFVTSFGGDVVVQSEPRLTKIINEETDRLRKEVKKELPKYEYPDYVLTAAMLQKYAHYGIEFKVRRGEAAYIRMLDSQKAEGKTIFGNGLLLSEKAAAEKAAAEKAAAEKADVRKWPLSEREKKIVAYLTQKESSA